MNDWCNQNKECPHCGDKGYIISYDGEVSTSQPGQWVLDYQTGWAIKPCVCQDNVYIKPPKQEWIDIWMNLAVTISTRSTCNVPNRNVGCVITSWDNTKVLALGYNGSAKGDDNSCEYNGDEIKVGSSRCTCAHAEMNCLTKLDTSNPCKKRMYVTLSPCRLCYKVIVNAGIDELIYKTEHYLDVLQELDRLGVKTIHYENH